eukprot:195486_1
MEIGEREQTVFKYEDIQLLVTGYCKSNSNSFIPSVIINILVMYLNSVFSCNLVGKDLNAFITSKCGSKFFSKQLNIEGVEFEYNIYPNGHKMSDGGFVTFYMSVVLFPAHILGITLYFELFCNELNYKVKKINTLSTHSKKWYPFKFKLCEIKNIKSINLNCFVDILRIKYNNKNTQPFDSKKGMKMSRTVKYKWLVDDKFKSKMKLKKIFYSNTFDHCWCLYTCNILNKNVYLQLLKLPYGVRRVKINCECTTGMTKKAQFGIIMSYYSGEKFVISMKDELQSGDAINIVVEIIKIFDMNDKEIDKSKWNIYINDAVSAKDKQ